MLRRNVETVSHEAGRAAGTAQITKIWKERLVVARFVTRVDALGPLLQASPSLQARVLGELRAVARSLDWSTETGVPSGYGRRVLYEDLERWSIAAVVLRPGQRTEMHDHAGWGCAVTAQGVERDRRFVHDASGNPVLGYARDYPAGTGYMFDPAAVHQPVGADPARVTVALHFLVHDVGHTGTHPETVVYPVAA